MAAGNIENVDHHHEFVLHDEIVTTKDRRPLIGLGYCSLSNKELL
jgi:hypothetical protein